MIDINILKLIQQILTTYLETLTIRLQKYKIEFERTRYEKRIIEDCQGITDIVNNYPIGYEDAEILLRHFIPILTECRPNEKQLKEYLGDRIDLWDFKIYNKLIN